MTRRLSALVLVAGFTVNSLAACGDEPVATPTVTRPTTPAPPPNSGKRLSEKEAFTIGVAVTAARRPCDARIPESRLRELVDDLVALARSKPDDIGTAFKGYPMKTPRPEESRERAARAACETRDPTARSDWPGPGAGPAAG